MKRFSRARLFMWAIIHSFIFVTLSTFVPRLALMTILNGIFLGIVVAVVIVYTPLVWFTFKKNNVDRVSQLALGIALIWVSIAGQRLYWIVWHANGMPEEWRSNPFLAALAFIAIIGGGLFVTAPGYPPEGSPDEIEFWGANRNMLLFMGGLGGMATFALSLYSGGAF